MLVCNHLNFALEIFLWVSPSFFYQSSKWFPLPINIISFDNFENFCNCSLTINRPSLSIFISSKSESIAALKWSFFFEKKSSSSKVLISALIFEDRCTSKHSSLRLLYIYIFSLELLIVDLNADGIATLFLESILP